MIRSTDPIKNGLSSFDFLQHRFNLPFKLVQAAVVFDYIVGEPPFFCEAQLRVDMLLRLGLVQTVPLLQTLKLGVDVTSDLDDRTKPFV